MADVARLTEQADEVIGNYKIEAGFYPGHGSVRKALGPWPLRNWSWITFFDGPIERCREYITWAERVDAGDKELVEHAANWMLAKMGVPEPQPANTRRASEAVEHLPKTWGYDFGRALSLFPPKPKAEVGPELMMVFIGIAVIVICGFLYHSAGPVTP
jgi:hypothetical protein